MTGGAGYIGRHTCVELLNGGHDVFVLDNFSRSHLSAIDQIQHASGRAPICINMDICDSRVRTAFRRHDFDVVIHLAALKSVEESAQKPFSYFHNNVHGTVNVVGAMLASGCHRLIFSSSAAIYQSKACLLTEEAPVGATSPYGRTKLIGEEVVRSACVENSAFKAIVLRYFNVAGSHPGGTLGAPNSLCQSDLFSSLCDVARGWRSSLDVYGTDYPTHDGTAVRDYIHVDDVALAHRVSVDYLASPVSPSCSTFNLGNGAGYSVLDVVKAFEVACGRDIHVRFEARRTGDIPQSCADATRAALILKWVAQNDLSRICRDAWRAHQHAISQAS
nr:UDP-glucose 4-epimerase GalE [Dyella terrae]